MQKFVQSLFSSGSASGSDAASSSSEIELPNLDKLAPSRQKKMLQDLIDQREVEGPPGFSAPEVAENSDNSANEQVAGLPLESTVEGGTIEGEHGMPEGD